MNSVTPTLDKKVEDIQARGFIEAVVHLMECEAQMRWEYKNDRRWLKSAGWRINIAVMAVSGLGGTVIRDGSTGAIKGVIMPKNSNTVDWLAISLSKREAVSVPGLPEDIGRHGYYDPCDEALMRSGGLTDLGTFSFEEWVNGK